MTYIVLEIQTDEDGHAAILPPITKNTLAEAESVWHTILAAAAVSTLKYHTAMVIGPDGNVIYSQCYMH